MSRQHLDYSDYDYLKEWGIRILGNCINEGNFLGLFRISERIAYFMRSGELRSGGGEAWLLRRLSDVHYIVAEMKFAPPESDVYYQSEARLIEMMGYIVEYFHKNGISLAEPLLFDSNGQSWEIPDSWANKFKDDLDHLD